MSQEVMELFNALESNRPRDVDKVKAEFSTMFNSVRDPWLINGLVNYHLRTGSVRAVEILVRAPECHAKHLFDRLMDGIRGDWRLPALGLLGHVVRRQPLWLHRIASHQLMKELLKLLRSERDIATLMSALLALITLLPMIPVLVGPHFREIFEIFKRLAAWDNARAEDPADAGRREHLQLGLYGLFYNLYGMYPCNFIDFLRQEYGRESGEREKREIFNHTVKPMLETVRMHPLLVTASKQHETQGARWQNMEHHDILVECRRFSLEGSDRQRTFEGEENRFRSRCGTDVASLTAAPHFESKASTSAPNLTEAQTQMKTTVTTSHVDPNAITYISKKCDSIEPGFDRWFSLTEGCDSGAAPSAPHTPLPVTGGVFAEVPSSRTPLAHLLVAALDGGSPPEAAIEATPENTPIKDLRTRFNFPSNSSQVVRSISRGLQHLPSHVAPSQSQPPSPLKKESSPFGRVTEMSDGQDGRKDRLNRIVLERGDTSVGKQSGGSPHKKQYPYQPHIGTSVPNSPIPIGTGAPASGSTDWVIAKPKPKKDGVAVESNVRDNYSESTNKEDREVTELTMRNPSGIRDDSRTPVDTPEMRQHARGYSVLYPDEWGEDELACEGSELQCRERNHGLRMPQSSSMLDFAKKVTTRIRFYSQCMPDPSHGSFPKSAATEARETLSKEGKLMKVSSCPDFRKNKSRVSTISTQTVDTWPSTYEFLLSDMFQGFCERPAKPKQPDLAPNVSQLSLCEQLDRYIESLYMRGGGGGGAAADRARAERLTEQLQLMHVQLLYERHRKEVHAVRNRRLLGKCRKNRATEEQNVALADRLKALQRENDELRLQIDRQNGSTQNLEAVNRQNAQMSQDKLVALEANLKEEKRSREKLSTNFDELMRKSTDDSADVQHLHAVVFDLTQRLERAMKGAEASEKLSEYVKIMQRELLMCGERESRITCAMASSPLANDIYLSKLLKQYKDELVTLQDTLTVTASKLHTLQSRESDLETTLVSKDKFIHELKKQKRLIQEDYEARLSAVEDKYKGLLKMNQRLECRILELLRFAPGFGSNAGSGNAGAGSREATSPHSSPLSASLASSDGPLAAHVALSDVRHLHHLLEATGAESSGQGRHNDAH